MRLLCRNEYGYLVKNIMQMYPGIITYYLYLTVCVFVQLIQLIIDRNNIVEIQLSN